MAIPFTVLMPLMGGNETPDAALPASTVFSGNFSFSGNHPISIPRSLILWLKFHFDNRQFALLSAANRNGYRVSDAKQGTEMLPIKEVKIGQDKK
jgi:hypothetical protein